MTFASFHIFRNILLINLLYELCKLNKNSDARFHSAPTPHNTDAQGAILQFIVVEVIRDFIGTLDIKFNA